MPTVEILDSCIAYTDTGQGDLSIVLLHGNPTSSHLWRNVIPHVADENPAARPDRDGRVGQAPTSATTSPTMLATWTRGWRRWVCAR